MKPFKSLIRTNSLVFRVGDYTHLTCSNLLTKVIDVKQTVYIDLQNAFDSVSQIKSCRASKMWTLLVDFCFTLETTALSYLIVC